jgi:hypothetical protein
MHVDIRLGCSPSIYVKDLKEINHVVLLYFYIRQNSVAIQFKQ